MARSLDSPRVANGVLGDRHLAEDATQQAFLDIWRDIRRLRDPARYEGRSHRLLVRVCYDEARRRPDWVTGSDLVVTGPATADVQATAADRDELERGCQRLSLDHRVALVMRFLLGMTPEEVAETLGLSLDGPLPVGPSCEGHAGRARSRWPTGAHGCAQAPGVTAMNDERMQSLLEE